MAEYYSRQLSQNIQRGMDYNAQHALYNGHKLFGYGVDKSTKRYIVDPDTGSRSCSGCSRSTPRARRCRPSATS